MIRYLFALLLAGCSVDGGIGSQSSALDVDAAGWERNDAGLYAVYCEARVPKVCTSPGQPARPLAWASKPWALGYRCSACAAYLDAEEAAKGDDDLTAALRFLATDKAFQSPDGQAFARLAGKMLRE